MMRIVEHKNDRVWVDIPQDIFIKNFDQIGDIADGE